MNSTRRYRLTLLHVRLSSPFKRSIVPASPALLPPCLALACSPPVWENCPNRAFSVPAATVVTCAWDEPGATTCEPALEDGSSDSIQDVPAPAFRCAAQRFRGSLWVHCALVLVAERVVLLGRSVHSSYCRHADGTAWVNTLVLCLLCLCCSAGPPLWWPPMRPTATSRSRAAPPPPSRCAVSH